MTKEEYLEAIHDYITQANEVDREYFAHILSLPCTDFTDGRAKASAWLATADRRLEMQKRREALGIELRCLERCLFNGIDMAASELLKTTGLQERLLSTVYGVERAIRGSKP